MLEQQRDYVLRSVEERGVRLIRLWFTDVLGNLKSLAISPAELENALDDGMTFDGSSIDGFSRIQEADVLAIPDPDTFELIPWSEPGAAEARVFCDIHHLDGTPFDGDPRQVLRRQMRAAHDDGFTFYLRNAHAVDGTPAAPTFLLAAGDRNVKISFEDVAAIDIVTFTEVFDHVSNNVRQATNGQQNPQRSGFGDIPLAIVTGSNPQEGAGG